jgi:hypothetical protein
MAVFENALWGYCLTYPDEWTHRTAGDAEAFAAIPEALQPDYAGPRSGTLVIRAEWCLEPGAIEPAWNRHIAMLASLMGARKVGGAPWHMGTGLDSSGGTGFEAEIVLPKQLERRLWTGILAHDFTLLHLMVSHLKEERDWFEPLATEAIRSLRFPPKFADMAVDEGGLPLPPGYAPADPRAILPDITDPERWRALAGESQVGALQAFYLREAPARGWSLEEFVPLVPEAELGFARIRLSRKGSSETVGIMPHGDGPITLLSPANVVVKTSAS